MKQSLTICHAGLSCSCYYWCCCCTLCLRDVDYDGFLLMRLLIRPAQLWCSPRQQYYCAIPDPKTQTQSEKLRYGHFRLTLEPDCWKLSFFRIAGIEKTKPNQNLKTRSALLQCCRMYMPRGTPSSRVPHDLPRRRDHATPAPHNHNIRGTAPPDLPRRRDHGTPRPPHTTTTYEVQQYVCTYRR